MKTKKNIEAKASKKNKAAKAEVTNLTNATASEKKAKKDKKAKVVKEVAKQQTVSIVEEVVSKRKVKWIYPEDVKDQLAKKSWRAKTRGELRKLELKVARIKDTNSKEYKQALKELRDKEAQVLKPGQVA